MIGRVLVPVTCGGLPGCYRAASRLPPETPIGFTHERRLWKGCVLFSRIEIDGESHSTDMPRRKTGVGGTAFAESVVDRDLEIASRPRLQSPQFP